MTIEPKLMDPDRLADYTSKVEECVSGGARTFPVYGWGDMQPVLAHAKHWEAEARREKKCRLDMDASWRLSMDLRVREEARALGLPALGDDWPAVIAAISTVTSNLADARSRARVAESAAEFYRDRCTVEATDVQSAGVTYAHLDAFAAVHGFAPARWDTRGLRRGRGTSDIGWARDGVYIGDCAAWPGNRSRAGENAANVADFVAMASTELERPAFDILAEMAAMDPS